MRARSTRQQPHGRRHMRSVIVTLLAACVVLCSIDLVTAAAAGDKPKTSQKASDTGFPTCQSQRGLSFAKGAVPMELNLALPVCGSFSHNTCCNTNNISPVLRATRLAQVGEFSDACQRMFETVMCFSCHPDVGTGKMTGICPGLCDAFYSSCANEFFLAELNSDPIPCQPESLVCSQVKDFATTGREMCASFGIQIEDDDSKCYNGAAPKTKGKEDRAGKARAKRASMRKPTVKEIWVETTKILGIKYKTRKRIESIAQTAWPYMVGVIVLAIATHFMFRSEDTDGAKRYSHRLGYEEGARGSAGVRVEGDVGEMFLAARARRLGEIGGSNNSLDSDSDEDEENDKDMFSNSGIEVVGAGDRKGARVNVVRESPGIDSSHPPVFEGTTTASDNKNQPVSEVQ